LPDVSGERQLGLAFDLIFLSAVWMHAPPPARARAFRKVAKLLKAGGPILISPRVGPSEPDRLMWPTPASEIEGFARFHRLSILRAVATISLAGQTSSWKKGPLSPFSTPIDIMAMSMRNSRQLI
jgi:hypothetical protein